MKHTQPKPKKASGDCWKEVIAYIKGTPTDFTGGLKNLGDVVSDMKDRRLFGIKKYGLPVQVGNGRDNLLDVYQELLDAAVYAMADRMQNQMQTGFDSELFLRIITNLIFDVRKEMTIRKRKKKGKST